MKRGFLFGLGWFLIFSVLGSLAAMFRTTIHMIAGIIAIVICVPLGVVAIRAAKSAPPNRSKVHAVVGWLIGELRIDARARGRFSRDADQSRKIYDQAIRG